MVQLTASWLERNQGHPEPLLVYVYAVGREGYVLNPLQGTHGLQTDALMGSGGAHLQFQPQEAGEVRYLSSRPA